MLDVKLAIEELEQLKSDAAVLPAAPDVVTFPEVLRQVWRDSRKDPEAYLDETTVRYGGE